MTRWRLLCLLLVVALAPEFAGCGEADQGPSRRLVDGDADGVASKKFFGRDCNDEDPNIPTRLEVPGDKIDNNCNEQVDELNAEVGHWRLSTVGQPKAKWDIDVYTNPKTAVQYIRCLQFQFALKSTVNGKTYNITQWQSGLRPTDIPVINNKFTWKLDRPDESVKIAFSGTFVPSSTKKGMSVEVRGQLVLSDSDKEVKAPPVTLTFIGKYQDPSPPDNASKDFCGRCYRGGVCPSDRK